MRRAGGAAPRRGFGLVEAVCALALLAAAAWAVVTLIVGSVRSSAGASRRMVLEMRARRHLVAAAGAPDGPVVRSGGRASEVTVLSDPLDATGYLESTDLLEEETHLSELEPGLSRITTRLRWKDRATGSAREVVAHRIVERPTFGLEHRSAPAVLP